MWHLLLNDPRMGAVRHAAKRRSSDFLACGSQAPPEAWMFVAELRTRHVHVFLDSRTVDREADLFEFDFL